MWSIDEVLGRGSTPLSDVPVRYTPVSSNVSMPERIISNGEPTKELQAHQSQLVNRYHDQTSMVESNDAIVSVGNPMNAYLVEYDVPPPTVIPAGTMQLPTHAVANCLPELGLVSQLASLGQYESSSDSGVSADHTQTASQASPQSATSDISDALVPKGESNFGVKTFPHPPKAVSLRPSHLLSQLTGVDNEGITSPQVFTSNTTSRSDSGHSVEESSTTSQHGVLCVASSQISAITGNPDVWPYSPSAETSSYTPVSPSLYDKTNDEHTPSQTAVCIRQDAISVSDVDHYLDFENDPTFVVGRRSTPIFMRRSVPALDFFRRPEQGPLNSGVRRESSTRSLDSSAFSGRQRDRSNTLDGVNTAISIPEDEDYVVTADCDLRNVLSSHKGKRTHKRKSKRRTRDSYGSLSERPLLEDYYSEPDVYLSHRRTTGGDDLVPPQDEDTRTNRLYRPVSSLGRAERSAKPVAQLLHNRAASVDRHVQASCGLLARNQGQTFSVTDGKLWAPSRGDPSDSNNAEGDSDTNDVDGDEDDEKKRLIPNDVKTEVYAARWYLLFIFSMTAFAWNAVWSTWGPIAQSAKAVYDWSDSDIAMFTWLGNAPFLVTMFPIAYLMDEKGMRPAMVLACGLMALGSGLRCIPCDEVTATWLIRLGQLLNGVAGTVPVSGPTLLSGLWFPANQRASATGIATVMGYLGACTSMVMGPLLVPEPALSPINGTSLSDPDLVLYDSEVDSNTNTTDLSEQVKGINTILYAEFALCAVLFLLALLYFPSKPPRPPSVSAQMPREEYVAGIIRLIKNKQFWVTAVAYSIPVGIYECWQVVLDVILAPKGVTQTTAGWMDFYSIIGGCVFGMLISKFADIFTRQMKVFLLVFYMLAAAAMLWFCCMVEGYLPFDEAMVYASLIAGGMLLDGGAPLFFELVIEVSYPVGEGVTSGCLQFICAAAGIVFLLLMDVGNMGNDWLNWLFFACIALAVPLLLFIKTDFGRADVDDADYGDFSDDESECSGDDDPDKKT